MQNFFNFLTLSMLFGTILISLFLILLSLPASRLRYFFLHLYSKGLYVASGLCVLYIISPIDLIPDLIPILGQVDDAAALVAAIFTGSLGWLTPILANNEQDQLNY